MVRVSCDVCSARVTSQATSRGQLLSWNLYAAAGLDRAVRAATALQDTFPKHHLSENSTKSPFQSVLYYKVNASILSC